MGLFSFFKKKNGKQEDIETTVNFNTIIFDVETTGFSPLNDEILQISIIDDNFNVLYDEMFKPSHVVSWDAAQRIHGITPRMVSDKCLIKLALNDIQKIFDKANVVVGYNVDFDIRFLQAAGIKGVRDKEIIDVMEEYAERFEKLKLEDAAGHFDYKYIKHNSLEDAKATLYVHNQLKTIPKKDQAKSKINNATTNNENFQKKIGDKTIVELQRDECEEAVNRCFKPNTPSYEGLHIFSNVYPPKEGYDNLNDAEKKIFRAFVSLCKENNVPFDKIRMLRYSNNDFVVDHPWCWAGRFGVKQKQPKYDIYSINSGKRKRVVKTIEEAEHIVNELGGDYEIRIRTELPVCHMTIFYTNGKNQDYENISVDELIETLPKMITYIKKCE